MLTDGKTKICDSRIAIKYDQRTRSSPKGAQIVALHELYVARAEGIILKEKLNNVIGRIYEETIY